MPSASADLDRSERGTPRDAVQETDRSKGSFVRFIPSPELNPQPEESPVRRVQEGRSEAFAEKVTKHKTPRGEPPPSAEREDEKSSFEGLSLEETASEIDDMMFSIDRAQEKAMVDSQAMSSVDRNATADSQTKSRVDQKVTAGLPKKSPVTVKANDLATMNLDDAEALVREMQLERGRIQNHGPKSMLHKRSPNALLSQPHSPSKMASPKARKARYARMEPRLKKLIFSGIQPTGIPHLGNYLGALRGWVKLQNEADPSTKLVFSLVDLHAITVQQDPQVLREQRQESFAMLMAVGLDPHQSIMFHQSDVSAHSELMWILSCLASTGYLSRMTQWKDKTSDESEDSGKLKLGLFSYPVLQAADILLYGATHVPVGEDQAQHLEFARELANSFNHNFPGETETPILIPPETIISPAKRIRSLTDPALKMSKSHPNEKSRILLTDDKDTVHQKIKQAVTDSIETEIAYDPETRPGISNLIDLLYYADPVYEVPLHGSDPDVDGSPGDSELEPLPPTFEAAEAIAKAAIVKDIKDLSKKALKERVADVVEQTVWPIRERYRELMGNPYLLEMEAELGARKAKERAEVTLNNVKRAIGLR
jgi:tryptophanyl-tRNA synthetase